LNYVLGRREFDFDGTRITVPRARLVAGPADLARAVREFADAAPGRDGENPMEESACPRSK